MPCQGRNLDDHCCYIKGKVCQFLEENSEPGFRWSCGLRRELGDWDKVLADPRYKPIADSWATGVNCKDWPDGDDWNGLGCSKCGANL
jgi:hypothetical protein